MTITSAPTWTVISQSVDQTNAIGRALAHSAKVGDVFALVGELGAGKTQLVRGIAGGLGIDQSQVASPTYVFVHEYDNPSGGPVLVHIDAYRVTGTDDLTSIGWEPGEPGKPGEVGQAGGSELTRGAVAVIEWADRIDGPLGLDVLHVHLQHHGESSRLLSITPQGAWLDRSAALKHAISEITR